MEAPTDLPMSRYAFVRALQRGDVASVERFVTHPTVREVTHRADLWLADCGRWRLVKAGSSRAIQNITTRLVDAMQATALTEERADDNSPNKRARLSAGDCVPWFLDQHGESTLRSFETGTAAYDVAAWLLQSSILDVTRYVPLLVLSTMAFDAVEHGEPETLELVLELWLGAPVWLHGLGRDDQADFIDNLARAWAETRDQPHDRAIDVANVLLAHGVGVESVQAKVELSDNNFCQFLVANGADLVGVDRLVTQLSSSAVGDTYLCALERAGVDPRAGGPFAVHHILAEGSEEAIRKLVGEWCLDLDTRSPDVRGLIPRASDARGFTPLMFAISKNKRDMVTMLLDNGADVMATDARGRSALAFAASLGLGHIVGELLKRGADPHHVDSKKRTVMYHAKLARPPSWRVLAHLHDYGATEDRRKLRRKTAVQ